MLLIGCLIEPISTPRSKSNTLTPKTKSPQEVAGEERVIAKSKPMMNLVSRCSENVLVVLSSTASESPGKTRHESQIPLSSRTEQHLRTGRPVKNACSSSSYSEWNGGKTWSSQEWKSGELMEVRTGRLVYEQPPGLFTEHTDKFTADVDDMDSNTVAESDLSLKSTSFLHEVNDRVRKSKDATQDSNQYSSTWRMFMNSTLQASFFMGQTYSENLRSIKNTEYPTLKQMFDISEKLIVGQSDEILWSDSN